MKHVDPETVAAHMAHIRTVLNANRSRVLDLFRKWDADRSGEVTKQEVREALKGVKGLEELPPHEIDALFHKLDIDGGGSVEFKELNRVMRRVLEEPQKQQLEQSRKERRDRPVVGAPQKREERKAAGPKEKLSRKSAMPGAGSAAKTKGGGASSGITAAFVEELAERMTAGHLLTAEEMAILEKSADEPDRPPPRAATTKAAAKSAPRPAPSMAAAKKKGGSGAGPSAAKGKSKASGPSVDELLEKMADGHLLSASEMAIIEKAEAEDAKGSAAPTKKAPGVSGPTAVKGGAKPAGKIAAGKPVAGKSAAGKNAAAPVKKAPPPAAAAAKKGAPSAAKKGVAKATAGASAGAGKSKAPSGGAHGTTDGSTGAPPTVEELMAKMGDGHLLTADEMAIIEKAEAEDEEALFVEGQQAAAIEETPLPPLEDDVTEEFFDELQERLKAGHLLNAKELAILEARGGDDDEDDE